MIAAETWTDTELQSCILTAFAGSSDLLRFHYQSISGLVVERRDRRYDPSQGLLHGSILLMHSVSPINLRQMR